MTVAQASRTRLMVGDPLPRLVLPDPAGGRLDFSHQSVAGSTLLLWLAAGPPAPEHLEALEVLVDELAGIEARPFVIAAAPPDSGNAGAASVPVLLDPER